jgi:uncharacterized protein YggU (UPF0235/DUF167 family)
VRPGAKTTQVLRWQAGVLYVSVIAPPIEGRANDAVVALVASTLGVPKRRVTLARGEKGRTKVLLVEGLDESAVAERLEPFSA